MFGVDYAWGNPGVPALKKAGVKFVGRYLSHDPGKNLRAGEAKLLRANDIHVVTVWESTADRAREGKLAGAEDARAAVAQLKDLGAPKDAPVYFAVDFDATEAEQTPINAYLKGAASVLGTDRVGVYGGLWVVKRALDAKVCRYAWQTYAWSGGKWDKRAHIQQYLNNQKINGCSVDYDRSMFADFGQWDHVRPKPKPRKPWPTPLPKWVWAWVKARGLTKKNL